MYVVWLTRPRLEQFLEARESETIAALFRRN